MLETLANPYLEQDVLSASPARLRWLLLQKAVGLCKVVSHLWEQGQDDLAAQWSLRLRDILGELLSGIRSADTLSRQVADIYVFSLQLLTSAISERSARKLEKLRAILDVEQETWLLVVRQTSATNEPSRFPQPMPLQTNMLSANLAVPATFQSFSFDA